MFGTDVEHVIDRPLGDAAYPRGRMLTLDPHPCNQGVGERWVGQDLGPNSCNTTQPWEGVGLVVKSKHVLGREVAGFQQPKEPSVFGQRVVKR